MDSKKTRSMQQDDPYYAPHEKIIESDLVNLPVINVIENIDERIEL